MIARRAPRKPDFRLLAQYVLDAQKTMSTERTQTRVLVVDDEESQRTALAGMIALWGYTVETAADGQEALDKLANFEAHVIVTDMMMPRMDGAELLKRLKAQGEGPPVIVQTAFGNLETAVATVHDLGAYWFLEKPVPVSGAPSAADRAAAQGRLKSMPSDWNGNSAIRACCARWSEIRRECRRFLR
jgi:DNA-binding NtrC family response regulator